MLHLLLSVAKACCSDDIFNFHSRPLHHSPPIGTQSDALNLHGPACLRPAAYTLQYPIHGSMRRHWYFMFVNDCTEC